MCCAWIYTSIQHADALHICYIHSLTDYTHFDPQFNRTGTDWKRTTIQMQQVLHIIRSDINKQQKVQRFVGSRNDVLPHVLKVWHHSTDMYLCLMEKIPRWSFAYCLCHCSLGIPPHLKKRGTGKVKSKWHVKTLSGFMRHKDIRWHTHPWPNVL